MRAIYLFGLLILATASFAQVRTDFNNTQSITDRGKFMRNYSKSKLPYIIPSKNINALLEKEIDENKSGEAKPFKIAEAIPVDIDFVKEAEWTVEDGYAYGKFTIVAAGAKSISVNFDNFWLPKYSELYVYSANGEMITGPVTESENNIDNFWGSWVYKGGTLTVEIQIPLQSKGNLQLHISSIAYGYKDLYVSNFGSASSCNVNVLCVSGWENEQNSVALILDGTSSALCSGALINNASNLNIPYLLTANHCFDGNVANWKYTFQAWSPTCSPTQNASGMTFNGSTLRARNAASDFCLLELNSPPPANSCITAAGWSRSSTAPSSGSSITHPRGDVMKIGTYTSTLTKQTFLGSSDWKVVWSSGTVEPGSSGGPLFDNNKRIIGQVHGGNPPDICTSNDHAFFGRFDQSWTGGGTNSTRLSYWLDPNNTGATTTNARLAWFSISGPSLICTTGQFTATTSVTWTSSNPSGLSIDTNTGLATRLNNFNGRITVTASINSGCGSVNVTRNVNVGNYLPIGTSSYNSNCSGNTFNILNTSLSAVCTANTPISFSYKITDSNYSNFVYTPVSVPSGATWSFSGGNLYMTVTTPPSQGSRSATIALSATGPCGTYNVNFTSTAVNIYSSFFTILPNPSQGNVTVSMENENLLNDGSQNLIYAIKITDLFGTLGESFEYKAGINSVKISLQNFNSGLYILSVFDGKIWSSERLIIQK